MSDIEYKGYKICTDRPFVLKIIKPIGKGSVPKELRGEKYTTGAQAMQAIDSYLSKVTKGGDTD